jgi:nucleoside-diphosphate-sugar epimerase
VRALVAGGAGFIGSSVVRELLARGLEVTVLDDFSTGRLSNIEPLLEHPSFTLLRRDVRQTPIMDVDVVLHLASPASPVDYDRLPLETLQVNSEGTRRLLEGACSRRHPDLHVDLGDLRRSARPPATRDLLGQRRSGRSTSVLRRGQALW